MRHACLPHRRRATALVSTIVILMVVTAFAAVVLSVHSVQITTSTENTCRLRAQAATAAATHLTLWKLRHDPNLQSAVARVEKENDTSFSSPALFNIQGDLAGATFTAELWPGPNTVRVRAVGNSGGVYDTSWAQMPIKLPDTDLLIGGDFEDPNAIVLTTTWLGSGSLGKWLAGYGITRVDLPGSMPGEQPWNISAVAGNHFAESTQQTSAIAQYVSGTSAMGPFTLQFSYLLKSGQMSVTVRGVYTLPPAGTLTPGSPAYNAWVGAGYSLYTSGQLAPAYTWTNYSYTIPTSYTYYPYYMVVIQAVGGASTPATPERAIDSIKLLATGAAVAPADPNSPVPPDPNRPVAPAPPPPASAPA